MDAHDKLLKQFEAATKDVVDLTVKLTEAQTKRDALRKQLRAALRNGHGEAATEPETDGASSEAVMVAVLAVRDAGEPVDAQRLADTLGVTKSIARTRLQRGVNAKLLKRLSRGKYEALPA